MNKNYIWKIQGGKNVRISENSQSVNTFYKKFEWLWNSKHEFLLKILKRGPHRLSSRKGPQILSTLLVKIPPRLNIWFENFSEILNEYFLIHNLLKTCSKFFRARKCFQMISTQEFFKKFFRIFFSLRKFSNFFYSSGIYLKFFENYLEFLLIFFVFDFFNFF